MRINSDRKKGMLKEIIQQNDIQVGHSKSEWNVKTQLNLFVLLVFISAYLSLVYWSDEHLMTEALWVSIIIFNLFLLKIFEPEPNKSLRKLKAVKNRK